MKCKITVTTEDACRYYNEGNCYVIETCPSGLTIVDPDIYEEIKAERIRQDEKYGKDRNLAVSEWNNLIEIEIEEALEGFAYKRQPPHDYRTEMVQVAALVVAAIESWDRQRREDVRI